MIRFHHILVPIDFEESSRAALDTAMDLALAFDARLTIVHGWEIPSYAYASMTVTADVWTPLEQAARDELAKTLAATRTRVPRAESILAQGSTVAEVLAAVALHKADLVVMGTHGRHGVSRMFLGSVAENVVRSSLVPVLTIRGAPTSAAKAERPSPAFHN